MKVLFIVNELLYTCGVSTHIYNLISGFKKNSTIELYLLCGGGVAISKFEDIGIDVLIDENIKHENRSIRGYIKAILNLSQLINKYEIDIIHSHHHYAASIAQKSGIFKNVKTIQTNHGILPEIGFINHFSSNFIIGVNQHIVDYIIRNKIRPPQKVRLIRSGFLQSNRKKEKANKLLKFLAASRLVKEKGLDTYIKAVKILPDFYRKRSEFYIAGEGDQENSLKKLNSNLNAGIEFLGRIENLVDVFGDFDVFVNPTRSKTEGFPMTLIEAGINKTLIITSDFWGLEPFFERDKDGIVFQQDNIEVLKNKIISVIDNYNYTIPLVNNFYNKTCKFFNVDNIVSETNSFYEYILSK